MPISINNPLENWTEITASSESEQLNRIKEFTIRLMKSKLNDKIRDEVIFCISEIVRNGIEWGNKFESTKSLKVAYCIFSDCVVIKCKDEGKGFIPNLKETSESIKIKEKERKEAGKRQGGYGIYLLTQLMDDVIYNEVGNEVILLKNF